MIKQIIPATNWFAVMFTKEEPYYFLDAIAFWALEQDSEGTQVRGYVGADFMDSPEESENFYIYTWGQDIGAATRKFFSELGKKHYTKDSQM